jgi:probable F420-dependent oxidoreductase
MPWSKPASRMRELVAGITAIWDAWESATTLDFRGDFYTHTRMIPAFDPGPNSFGRPPIFTAGVGPQMTAVAGESADGFLVHPVNSRRSLLELTIPALETGARRSGRLLEDLEIVCVTIIVTGRDEAQFAESHEAVRKQLAFYGTTPAYTPVFELHGYGELAPELRRLARDERWDDMATLIPDDLIETIAVVGEPHEIAAKLAARLKGISESVALVNNRAPDPEHFAEVVADLREQPAWPGSGPRLGRRRDAPMR